jgi:uncharacterized protein YdaU (DUF1376 family)
VNYYEFHIGDYQRKTAHLSLAEHGAYSLMLQTFYATERPLPADRKVLYRLLRADSATERKAVDAVIVQFWQSTAIGLTNSRAAEVLDEYKRWVAKQKANGSRGGRPPKTEGLSQEKANGGDSHLNSPSSPPKEESNPLPPFEKGASSKNRSDIRTEKDEALAAWAALLASKGAKRNARVQAAIDAVGGWSRIEQRETGMDSAIVRKQFCDAYRSVAPP